MKNGNGLKIGMSGIILASLLLGIINNHNPSQVFAQAKANATSIQITSPFALDQLKCDLGEFNNMAQYTFQCKDRL